MFQYLNLRSWVTLKPAVLGDELLEEVVINSDHISHMYGVVTDDNDDGTAIVMANGDEIIVAAKPSELIELITKKE